MFSLREAAALIPGATVIGDDSVTFERVSTDSRSAGPGDLFVAIKGERFDAHDFLADVAARNVTAALVSRAPQDWNVPALRVKDTRVGLGALARGWRRKFGMPLVAVTGSNGKTTVKEMIASIFAAAVGADARLATAGNFNNDIGLPLTLFRLNAAHRLAVVELGMNHPGETSLLAKIAEPTVAVVNNAQREHQEFMATVEAVALEHASVIHALSPDGVAVFPADDAFASIWRVAATGNRIVDFALNTDERTTAAAVTGRFDGKLLSVDTPQGHVEITLQVLGNHNAHNALAATSAALAAGVSLDAIKRGLESFGAVKGRLQVKHAALGTLAGATVIDDTYNANPDSMRAYARERGIDALYAMGDASRDACTAYGAGAHHVADIGTLVAQLQQAGFGAAATLLVKGSRFMQMERVVDAVTSPQPNAAGSTPAAH
jgi:UDP-N-acetylmuramoyl-tripeptide--D-alanyl-D-alanine ligase